MTYEERLRDEMLDCALFSGGNELPNETPIPREPPRMCSLPRPVSAPRSAHCEAAATRTGSRASARRRTDTYRHRSGLGPATRSRPSRCGSPSLGARDQTALPRSGLAPQHHAVTASIAPRHSCAPVDGSLPVRRGRANIAASRGGAGRRSAAPRPGSGALRRL